MKTLLLLALALLAGCDRGIATECLSSDSTCTQRGLSGSVSGGQTPSNDTTSHLDSVTTSDSGLGLAPAYDVGEAIKMVPVTALAGVSSIWGGQERRLAVYLQDSTLHLVASSDGESTTPGRKTIFDILVLATDSMVFAWDRLPEPLLGFRGFVGTDMVSGKPLAVITMPAVARTCTARITAPRHTTLKFWVKVHSGLPTEHRDDPLPLENIASTRAMLVAGEMLTPIGSDPFVITIP